MNRALFVVGLLAVTFAAQVATAWPAARVNSEVLQGYEHALERFDFLIDHPSPIQRLRQVFASHASKQFYWEEYYAHTARHFSGTVSVDPGKKTMNAVIRVRLKVLGDGHTTIAFLTDLPVNRVLDSQGNELEFTESNAFGFRTTKVRFEEAPADGEEMVLQFEMEGTPSCASGGAFQVQVCKLDDDITYLASTAFLPVGLMGDFATMDLEVAVPAGYVVAATGEVVNSTETGGDPPMVSYHVVQDFPTDIASMAISEYVEARVPSKFGTVTTYTKDDPLIYSILPEVLKDMEDILVFFSDLYGDFIFPKLGAAQVTDDAGAAFGWPALVWIPSSMFLLGSGGGGGYHAGGQRTALFAHELAHQWFPDAMKSEDPYAPWLSEGFAEFNSVYYMSSKTGQDFMRGVFGYYSMLYRYFVSPKQDYPLTSQQAMQVQDPFVYQVITYFKGAVVVNTIRQVIGHKAFVKALRKLYDDLAGKPEFYVTEDLQRYFEEAYGDSLDWLFLNWVYGKGYPIYTVAVDPKADGTVTIRVDRSSSVSNNTFVMPVKLVLVTDSGKEERVETIGEDTQTFVYEPEGRFTRLEFDPEVTFIRRVVPSLAGDFDLSGEVDGIDLLYAAWSKGAVLGKSSNFLPFVDTNQDGVIDGKDTAAAFDNFGATTSQEAK